MNVGFLIQERDRLLAVIEEAKSAKVLVKDLNRLITRYGAANITNGTITPVSVPGDVPCDQPGCDRVFENRHGLAMHKRKAHGIAGTRGGVPYPKKGSRQ